VALELAVSLDIDFAESFDITLNSSLLFIIILSQSFVHEGRERVDCDSSICFTRVSWNKDRLVRCSRSLFVVHSNEILAIFLVEFKENGRARIASASTILFESYHQRCQSLSMARVKHKLWERGHSSFNFFCVLGVELGEVR